MYWTPRFVAILQFPIQNRLYKENEEVWLRKSMEDHLSQRPYLLAVFHETLRKYSPVPVLPLRYAHEGTQLGYFVPAGSQVKSVVLICIFLSSLLQCLGLKYGVTFQAMCVVSVDCHKRLRV